MTESPFARPLPAIEPDTRPFWDGLREHRLVLQRCVQCGQPRHYPRPMCDRCFSLESEWFEASGHGAVHSWTVCHHAFHPGFKADTPYVLVTADLAEGVRMVAPVSGDDAQHLALGRPVRVAFEDVDGDLTLPRFRLDG